MVSLNNPNHYFNTDGFLHVPVFHEEPSPLPSEDSNDEKEYVEPNFHEPSISLKLEKKDTEKENDECKTAPVQNETFPLTLARVKKIAFFLDENGKWHLLLRIVNQIIDHLIQTQSPCIAEMREIWSLLEDMPSKDVIALLDRCVNLLPSTDIPKFIQWCLQALYYQVLAGNNIKEKQSNINSNRRTVDGLSQTDVFRFKPTMLLDLVQELLAALITRDTGVKDCTLWPAATSVIRLHSLVMLVDILTFEHDFLANNNELKSKIFETLNMFEDEKSLRVLFLSNYGIGLLKDVQDGSFSINKVSHQLRTLVKIQDQISYEKPWKFILQLINGQNSQNTVINAEKETNEHAYWLLALLEVRSLIFCESSYKFYNLLRGINESPEEMVKEFPITHPYFIAGCCELVLEILALPFSSPEVKERAIKLFEAISNLLKKPFFTADLNLKTAVGPASTAIFRLKACEEIFLLVEETAQRIKISPKIPNQSPPGFVVIDQTAPLISKLHQIQMILETDSQLKQKAPLYIELYPERDFSSEVDYTKTIQEQLHQFLKDPDQCVLALIGERGSGKTLSIHVFINSLFKAEELEFFPILISLANIKEPCGKAIEETLNRYKFNRELISQLQNLKILWIFDDYDKIDLSKPENSTNIYIANQIQESYPHSKCIFVNRQTGSGTLLFFSPKSERNVMVIKSFNSDTVQSYLEKFVKQYDKFIKAIKHEEWFEMINNPFRLKMMVDLLPYLAEKTMKEYPEAQDEGMFTLILTRRLFEAFSCCDALIASRSCPNAFSPSEFLFYTAELAYEMHLQDLTSIQLPLGKHEKIFGRFINGKMNLLFKQALVYRKPDGWRFSNEQWHSYFVALWQDYEELEKLVTMIDSYSHFI